MLRSSLIHWLPGAAACLFITMGATQSFGQSVVSVRSGLINFSEGEVLIDGQPLQRRFGTYASLKAGSDLVTRSGRAELLLTPNTYFRVGSETAVRMISDNLTDTRIELLGGSAMLDSSTAGAKTPVTITLRDAAVRFTAPGKFRLDSDPPQLRVFEGSAEVDENGKTVKVEPEQLLPLSGAPIVKRFTEGSDNLLDLWSDERHMLIASNISDSQSYGDPLTDPDPDPTTLAGNYPYPGYIPLLGYPPLVGATNPGLGVGYGTVVYGPYGAYSPYSPYGVYSPYSPYGVYGGLGYGIYTPLYLRTVVRPGFSGITGLPSSLGGLRTVGGVTPGTIHTFTPSRPIVAPHPLAPRVGGHR
jgi:FecR protein